MLLELIRDGEHCLMVPKVEWSIYNSKLKDISSLNDANLRHFAPELVSSFELKAVL